MSFSLNKISREQKVLAFAVLIALIAAAYYFFSGHSNLDQNSRALTSSDSAVENISEQGGPDGQKTLEIKCKDGSSYDIYYPPGETNYDALAASKC